MKMRLIQLKISIMYFLVLIYVIIFRHKEEDIWLISERGDEARDNGFSFFKYLKSEHPEINSKYVITCDSPDLYKLAKYNKNDIVKYQSWKHMYFFITAKVLASTHIMGFSPEFRMMGKLQRKRLLYFKGKQVFLQHGITKDDSPGLYYENTNLDLFICGAKNEYEYVNKKFKYTNGAVKYTGFARYDDLNSEQNKTILLMPTWRENLYHLSDSEFINSNYYKVYNSLINNNEIEEILRTSGYKLLFYPHYEIQKRIYLFNTSNEHVIVADSKNYSVPKLLKQTSLLITDFSSVYFDVAYMKKPVIYYHFDYDNYRKNHYKEGYFSYEKDGFGDICTTEKEIVLKIKQYLKNNFNVEKKYYDRSNKFFKYRDRNNCERIYNEIIKILK